MSRSGSHSRSSSHRRSSDDRRGDHNKKDRKSSRRDGDRKKHRSASSDPVDDEDERLLKQAKEFIEQQQQKSKHNKSSNSSSKRRSRSPERSRKRHRRDRDDHDDKHKDRHDNDDDDDDDDKSSKKSSSRKSSSRKSHRRRDDDDNSRDDGKNQESRRRRRSPSSSSANHNHNSDGKKHKRHHKKEHKKHSNSRKKEDKKDQRKKDRKKDDKKDKNNSRHRSSEPSAGNNTQKPKQYEKPDKSSLVPLGDPPGKPPAQLLDPDRDYFAYHQPLWVWLYREEGSAFNDLTSDESREAFGRFVEQFNAGQLEAAYYDTKKGLPPAAVEECKTTRHKWSFQTNETERKGLKLLEDGVRKLTEYADPAGGNTSNNTAKKQVSVARKPAPSVVAPRPNPQPESNDGRRQPWTTEERLAHQAANKRLKQHVRTAEEEFSGGAKDYGRDRQLEKKREVGARTHGAARDREDPGMALSDDALYGGGSFQAALERERQRKARRNDSKQARIQELQQKDDAKKKAMLEALGLSTIAATGQKIKIAPRQDESAGK